MFTILGIMFAGILCGYFLRHRQKTVKTLSRLILPVVWILLFLMGISVGRNGQIMQHLSSLGWEALLLTLGALAGSVLLAYLVYIRFFKPSGPDAK